MLFIKKKSEFIELRILKILFWLVKFVLRLHLDVRTAAMKSLPNTQQSKDIKNHKSESSNTHGGYQSEHHHL